MSTNSLDFTRKITFSPSNNLVYSLIKALNSDEIVLYTKYWSSFMNQIWVNITSETLISNYRIQSTWTGFLLKTNNYGRLGLVNPSTGYSYLDFSGKETANIFSTAILCWVLISSGTIDKCVEITSAYTVYITQIA